MFRTNTLALMATLGVALASWSTSAAAGNITITNIELPHNDELTLSSPISGAGYIGEQVLTTSTGLTIDAWCIDLYHDDNEGSGQSLSYQTAPIMTNNDGTNLNSTQISEIAGLVVYGDQQMTANPSDDVSAAIQLAIWTVEYGTITYTGGNANLTALTAEYFADASSLAGDAVALVSLNGEQGLVTADPRLVPEPASLALLGAGLTGLGVMRRKRA